MMALRIILGILGLIWLTCGTILNIILLESINDHDLSIEEYYSSLKCLLLHYIIGPILMICIIIAKHYALDKDKDTDFKASDDGYKRYVI